MIKTVINTKKYFQAPSNYFWKWAEGTDVIEWRTGTTICYRDDLVEILSELSMDGFPPLSSLLWVIMACKEEMGPGEKQQMMRIMTDLNLKHRESELHSAFGFLEVISALPTELKKGEGRIHLIHEIFGKPSFVFSNVELKAALAEIRSGRLDALIREDGDALTSDEFLADLQYLCRAFENYPTVARLELKLKTGLSEVPGVAEIDLPEYSSADLIEQLELDENTIALARLARQLIPVLNIPMHLQGSGDQSYGGISDITNRGNYDRLLLSELAHDDLLLTARLVNNEALYFRREEPPENPKRQRTILLDTTIRMWGIPRIYAISAALAFAHNSKHNELIESYALKGEDYVEINLHSKDGVVEALGELHHALHCGKSLESLINDQPVSEQNEYILVTEAGMLRTTSFLSHLANAKASLSFIVTVSRSGELHFYECIKGNTRLLSTAKINLDEVLNVPVVNRKDVSGVPAFLTCPSPPLLLPKVMLKESKGMWFEMVGVGLVIVTHVRQVMLIRHSDKGGEELMGTIETGDYTFGWDEVDNLFILVNNRQKNFVKLYTINLGSLSVHHNNLSEEIPIVKSAEIIKNILYLSTGFYTYTFDCIDREIKSKVENDILRGFGLVAPVATQKFIERAYNYYKGPLNGFTRMFRFKDLYVGDDQKLVLGHYKLGLTGHNRLIRLMEIIEGKPGAKYAKEKDGSPTLLPNKRIRFSRRVWQDGSEAVVDGRGFLHLKSSDLKIPEITIVLVVGVYTACWASDGVVCGSAYFFDPGKSDMISSELFYKKYIQAFIDRLV
ncbi:MAG TPA: hypothetical protein VFZ42_01260 [Chitinophagaceae bacterium]